MRACSVTTAQRAQTCTRSRLQCRYGQKKRDNPVQHPHKAGARGVTRAHSDSLVFQVAITRRSQCEQHLLRLVDSYALRLQPTGTTFQHYSALPNTAAGLGVAIITLRHTHRMEKNRTAPTHGKPPQHTPVCEACKSAHRNSGCVEWE